MRDGKLVLKHLATPLDPKGPRSALPTPHYISDSLPDIVHPSSGKRYSSKAAFRAETRARGLTEVGNESFPERKEVPLDPIGPDIARAYDQLASGEVSIDAPTE
jgi:hypothetical protein